MEVRLCGNEFRTMLVCVDSCSEHGVMTGRIYNPYLPGGRLFSSIMEFLQIAESLLDELKLPQAFAGARTFGTEVGFLASSPPVDFPREGKLGTFSLRVLFRQNASWQGSVTWMEGGKEEHFRSVLELLRLLSSAVSAGREQPAEEASEQHRYRA